MPTDELIGQKIKELRIQKGMSQEQLANAISISKSSISEWEACKRTPRMPTLRKIAAALGVSIDRLVTWKDADEAASDGERLTNHMLLNGDTAASLALALGVSIESVQRMCADDLTPTPEQRRFLADRYGVSVERLFRDDVEPAVTDDPRPLPRNAYPMDQLTGQPVRVLGKAAAGEPIYAPEDYDVYVNSPVKCDAAIEVQGDSMEPDYLDGDMVYIRCRPDVDDGQVAVVFLDDDAVIKEVCHVPDGLLLLSKNKQYKPLRVSVEDYPNLRIFGVPVGFTRMYKAGPLSMIHKGFR